MDEQKKKTTAKKQTTIKGKKAALKKTGVGKKVKKSPSSKKMAKKLLAKKAVVKKHRITKVDLMIGKTFPMPKEAIKIAKYRENMVNWGERFRWLPTAIFTKIFSLSKGLSSGVMLIKIIQEAYPELKDYIYKWDKDTITVIKKKGAFSK